MRVGGMNLTLMAGPKFIDSIMYTNIEKWEFTADHVLIIKQPEPGKKKGENLKVVTKDGSMICVLMEGHINLIVAEKQERKKEADEAEVALAKEGKLTGDYIFVRAGALRKEKEMDSEKLTTTAEGTRVKVTENAVLEDGKIRMKVEGDGIDGWVSLKSTLGPVLSP